MAHVLAARPPGNPAVSSSSNMRKSRSGLTAARQPPGPMGRCRR